MEMRRLSSGVGEPSLHVRSARNERTADHVGLPLVSLYLIL